MPTPQGSFLQDLQDRVLGGGQSDTRGQAPGLAPQGYIDLVNGQQNNGFLNQVMSLVNAKGGGGGGLGGGMPGYTDGNYQFGNAFNPGQDLMTQDGVTLQASAMQDLLSAGPAGQRILDAIGGGYRSIDEQRRLYQAYLNGTHPALVAPPGHSYHNYGLAFDLSDHLGPHLQQVLQNLGWRNEVPGEWWHWSIGDAPWGGN